MPKINQYGIFEGGVCHKRLDARKRRAEGARMAWNNMKDMEYVKNYRGWYQIKKIQSSTCMGTAPDANFEIGYLRMLQVVFPNLMKLKRKFRLSNMEIWIEAIASAECGVSQDSPLSIITPGERFFMGLMPPTANDDAIYEQMYGVQRGLLKHQLKTNRKPKPSNKLI